MQIITMTKTKQMFTIDEFYERYGDAFGIQTEEDLEKVLDLMVQQGICTIKDDEETEEDTLANKILHAEEIISARDQLLAEEENYNQKQREEKLNNTKSMTPLFPFINSLSATEFQDWLAINLNINSQLITERDGSIKVRVPNVTPQEYTKIERHYNTEKGISKATNLAQKGADNLTNAVNYSATKIVAPTAKIAGRAGLNIAKTLVQTGVKVGAGLVSNTRKCINDTKRDLSYDRDILTAKADLKDASNCIKRKYASFVNKNVSGSSGITFE